MRRLLSLFLSIALIAGLCACGGKKEETLTWQEQYDLGVRYLSEGNYQEAILAFTAAIEIDPKQADAYINLADAYIAAGDTVKAEEILRQGLEAIPEDETLLAKLVELVPTPTPEPTPVGTVTIAGKEYPLDTTELDLSRIELTDQDIVGLARLTDLTILRLGGSQISDLSPLAGLTKLTNLDILGTPISDISPLSGLTELKNLYLWGTQISDLSPLAELSELTVLSLSDNPISDLSPLAGLTQLTTLDLSSNKISDLSPLAELTNLTSLSLAFNDNISDITPLRGLNNLTRLDLRYNQISDISPLDKLTNLTYLHLAFNEISNLSPLAGLINITDLNLYSNQITDLSPLFSLINLQALDLLDNPLTAAQIAELQAALKLTSTSSAAPATEYTEEPGSDIMLEAPFDELLNNDDKQGWIHEFLASPYPEWGDYSPVYLRFFPDGTLKYWLNTPGPSTLRTEPGQTTYRIEANCIFIGDDEYEIVIDQSSLDLTAIGLDTLGLAGTYELGAGWQYVEYSRLQ